MQGCDFAENCNREIYPSVRGIFSAQGAIIADVTKMTWQFMWQLQITTRFMRVCFLSKISNLDSFLAELAKINFIYIDIKLIEVK